jgi:cyclohexa-1,5-dienecarbonyl-CoA hydratase
MTESASPATRLELRFEAAVARLTLRHPPLNVIDLDMMDQLASAWSQLEARDDISTVVFHGDGSNFSAGVDVRLHAPELVDQMLEKFHHVIRSLLATEKITIAGVDGHCLGGGAELAMLCDLVITSHDALWGFPEITLACYPPVAVTALSALVGHKRAADLILSGRTISGREAAQMGLATEAVEKQELEKELEGRIAHLKTLSAAALSRAKKSLYGWEAIHFDKGLARAERIYRDELMRTEDAREGIRAFLEKRTPQWKGR